MVGYQKKPGLKRIFVVFFFFLAFIQAAQAQSVSQSATEDELADFFNEKMAEQHIPGLAFVMIENGEVHILQGYGLADRQFQLTVVPEETVFRIASVSKVFTAAAVMQLVESGQIDLHEDVNTYLSDFQLPETFPEPITPYHLLTHTAGFEDQDIGFLVYDPDQMVPLADYVTENMPARVYPPGSVMAYSNYGITLAGYLVESVSGQSFATYVQDHVFTPLGMTRSTFEPLEMPQAMISYRAKGYQFSQQDWHEVDTVYPRGGVSPEGGMVTTAGDMAVFIQALLGDSPEVFSPSLLDTMLTRQFSVSEDLPGIGMGFWERKENGQQVFYHAGDTEGFASELVLVPERDWGYFVVYNGYSWKLKPELARMMFDRSFPVNHFSPAADPVETAADLSLYTGEYRSTRFNHYQPSKLIVLTELSAAVRALPNGHLEINFFGLLNGQGGAWEYAPVGNDMFRNLAPPGQSGFYPGDTAVFQAGTDEMPARLFISSTAALERLPYFEGSRFQVYLLLVLLVVFLCGLLVPLFRVLLRRLRKQSEPADTFASRLQMMVTGTSVFNLGFLLLFIPQLLEIKFGITEFLSTVLLLPYASALLATVLVFMTWRAWKLRTGMLLGRMALSIFTAFSMVFVFWAQYWNLL